MIREVRQEDAAAIAAINNHYVMHSDASFDTEPTDGETMRQRIAAIAAACPYFVCEEEGYHVLGAPDDAALQSRR